ncbi:PhoX family protein [Nocardioides limicola]|uniref:PhoX family protein n=1 Tax=Nocardioides limicola TaxID=2803368 RepID=UPI00193B3AEB|nr:PhoX family phosphatase [Nocardioides sp. DJM-14]
MTTYIDIDPDEISDNPTEGPDFADVAAARASRRGLIGGGMALAAGFLTTPLLAGPAAATTNAPTTAALRRHLLGFEAIGPGYGNEVVVPPGYTARAFVPWGTPISGNFPEFRPGENSAADQEHQVGMHHDGMHYFPLHKGPRGNEHGLLVINHEYTAEDLLHTGVAGVPPVSAWTAEMVAKSQAAHGVSVIEVRRTAGGEWVVVPSRFNRRVTANTPMAASGPAAGHRLLRTAADPIGRSPIGTVNNCSMGPTPWGTYLTCEENFQGYFAVESGDYPAEVQTLMSRYGVGGDRFRWATHDDRFRVTAADPNEPHRFGWIVEIDPFDPHSRPIKRTALGRFKHESAYVHTSRGGRVVVYSGDDQAGEHVYKFVSSDNWHAARARGRSPLDEGTLYVARFNEDGSGDWLPLVQGRHGLDAGAGFADQGDVLVKTRLAASVVGATRMDRPEWVAMDTNTGLVYLTLTNNTSSSKQENAANPRVPNRWGHIIRWRESGDDHTSTRFEWDLFVLAGQGRDSGDGSTVPAEAAFGSPDGLWCDADGRVWIQTDGAQPAGANDQMLAANPYRRDAHGAPEIKRFLTGVAGCEVTGVITTPDQRTMFVNLQHPGEGVPSTWPHLDGITTPRSATVVITKDDGGIIGS